MKNSFGIIALAAAALMFTWTLAPQEAHAKPKPWVFSWWLSHWDNLDFKPYPDNTRHTHDMQWNKSLWKPDHWIAQRGGDGTKLIQGFYKAGIIRDQYEDDDIPVLEVGPVFYELGGEDKRRVMATVDAVYGITSGAENGMFTLTDWRSGQMIGAYTRYGLQMQ